ncbi:hypothetical protein [Actinomadura rubrisoli]|uniref:Uncharacterized protein n=1 Tax=Actinomadura rubrisoli TaxID=2530368 RepID=A0A4R5CA05_9ACTN|nr:hypothetical protein [Actinomadura rubrisoli]TDD93852.1 hypothetical protein E1298_08110 [Actinomadura rubrisoli]
MDIRLQDAFRPVAHDLAAAGYAAELASDSLGMKDGMLRADLRIDGERLGIVAVDPAWDSAISTRQLAEQAQDLILEYVRPGHGAPMWPECRPGHPHPMTLAREIESATWTCPRDPDYQAPVGTHPGLIP